LKFEQVFIIQAAWLLEFEAWVARSHGPRSDAVARIPGGTAVDESEQMPALRWAFSEYRFVFRVHAHFEAMVDRLTTE